MAYSTLDTVVAELKAQGNDPNVYSVITGKQYVINALDWVTRRIDSMCQMEFAPRRQTRYFDATSDMALDPYLNSIILDKPLVDIVSCTVADTVLGLWTPNLGYQQRINYDYFLYPVNSTPYYKLQATKTFYPLFNPALFSVFAWFPQAYQQAVAVDGLWCYREYYSEQGYESSGQTVQDNPLSSSATTLTVSSNAVFSPGQWFRFKDQAVDAVDEIALVTDVPMTSTNTLTIARGERGTTATSHAQNCEIDLWITEPNINRACTRWTAYLYQRRAVYETAKVITGGAGSSITLKFPLDAPEEIQGILANFINYHISKA